MIPGLHTRLKPTPPRVVIPFYAYAALSLLASALLLLFSFDAFAGHYFQPRILAITHIMALGWGTMMILGASHQLVPVLIEAPLYSNRLALLSFVFGATGIPPLVYGFFIFHFGWLSQLGGILVNFAILTYVINLVLSVLKSKKENVHAVFVVTASLWLLGTTLVGLLLLYNFSVPVLPRDSIKYLSLHAHMGIGGWFLLLVMGVGSRLIPMFLISKYQHPALLWKIYLMVNSALAGFVLIFVYGSDDRLYFLPVALVVLAILAFLHYCFVAWRQRIRRQVDEPMKISLLSAIMLLLPMLILMVLPFIALSGSPMTPLVTAYGFVIFFGWLTAIIIGMTFKTLPFIVWNLHYHALAGKSKTPNPKDLFSEFHFKAMEICYLGGFLLFVSGILLREILVLGPATVLLLLAAVFYNWNIGKLIFHKTALP